jgi:DNA-binding response OmpR family regulator/HPt (histidine-containing phosphotransfer) domain-containing protein
MASKKLLIIEDDSIIANIYRSIFEKENFQVDVAADGQSGFYKVHEMRPDVILLDLMLPIINGVDILRKIRAQKQFEKLPVIVFTNAYLPDMVADAMKAGARQVFNKATLAPRDITQAVHDAIFSPNTPVPDSSGKPGTVMGTKETGLPAANGEAPLDQSFLENAPELLGNLRSMLQTLVKSEDETTRLSQLNELYRKVHTITGGAGIAGLRSISQMCSALEALIKELYEKPKNINASTLRTVAHSIDFLGVLFSSPKESPDPKPISILVVDDEILSRRAVTAALEKANLKPIGVSDPNIALTLINDNQFDLVILDVDMPGMSGFDLCTKLRALPNYKSTPVIFVTSLSDFESRAKSSMSGGNDLIAKPFLFMELNVKALTYVLKSRLQTARPA